MVKKSRKSRKTNVELTEFTSTLPIYEYKEPEIVEPKIKSFGGMYKDAGAGVVKFFKVTAKRDNENNCSVVIKSGKLGHKISTDIEEGFDNFISACKKAEELIEAKKKRGYKIK